MIRQIWKNIFGAELIKVDDAYTYTFPRGENMSIGELAMKLTRLNSSADSSLQVSLHLEDGSLVLIIRELEKKEEPKEEVPAEEPVQDEEVKETSKSKKNKNNKKEIKENDDSSGTDEADGIEEGV